MTDQPALRRFALLLPDGTVSNIVLWDGAAPYRPEGVELAECPDGVDIGWRRTREGWVPIAAGEPEA